MNFLTTTPKSNISATTPQGLPLKVFGHSYKTWEPSALGNSYQDSESLYTHDAPLILAITTKKKKKKEKKKKQKVF